MNLVDLVQVLTLIKNDKKPEYVLTAENLNRVLDLANRKIFSEKLSKAEQDGRVQDELAPFKVVRGVDDMPLVFVNGLAQKPSNCFYALAMNAKRGTDVKEVELVNELHWAERMGNAITKPTLRDPICRDLGTRYQIEPSAIQYCGFSYYRLPRTPYFTFKGANVEFEYDNITVLEVLPYILNLLGFSIPSAEIVAYAQNEKK